MSKLNQKFAIHNNIVRAYIEQEGSVVDKVPAAFYHVEQHPLTGQYFLVRKADRLTVPEELYGTTEKRASMVMATFERKPEQLGVALFGTKGAGKTLLSNVIANKALDKGLPVIDISNSFSDSSEYLDFINSIGECVIIFDEFLKVLKNKAMGDGESAGYRAAERGQEKMLTFFSGSNNAKRLTILIDNEAHLLNDYFLNRPSRLRYIFRYTSVEAAVIEALAAKHNLPTTLVDELITYSAKYHCTFDMINELLDEIVTLGDYQNIKLSEITNYFNVPAIGTSKNRKVRATNFKFDEEASPFVLEDIPESEERPLIKLANEVVVKHGWGVHVGFERLAPWAIKGETFKDEKEFDKAYPECYNFSDYKNTKENGYYEFTVGFTSSHLSSIVRGMSTYSTNGLTVTIVDDIEEQEETNFYDAW